VVIYHLVVKTELVHAVRIMQVNSAVKIVSYLIRTKQLKNLENTNKINVIVVVFLFLIVVKFCLFSCSQKYYKKNKQRIFVFFYAFFFDTPTVRPRRPVVLVC
jgi:hypothetical protein